MNETQLLRSQRAKIFDSKEYLLNFLAHELKNPLTVILNSVELLRQAPEEVENLQLDRILEKTSVDINELIEEMLEFSKLESRNLKFERENLKLKKFAGSLEFKCSGMELLEDQEFVADARKVRRILSILANIALKQAKSANVAFSVKIEASQAIFGVHGRELFDQKKDKKKFEPSIFEEFTKESQAISKELGASGLALNICYHLAKNMEGELWFGDDAQGERKSFYLGVPMAEIKREGATRDASSL